MTQDVNPNEMKEIVAPHPTRVWSTLNNAKFSPGKRIPLGGKDNYHNFPGYQQKQDKESKAITITYLNGQGDETLSADEVLNKLNSYAEALRNDGSIVETYFEEENPRIVVTGVEKKTVASTPRVKREPGEKAETVVAEPPKTADGVLSTELVTGQEVWMAATEHKGKSAEFKLDAAGHAVIVLQIAGQPMPKRVRYSSISTTPLAETEVTTETADVTPEEALEMADAAGQTDARPRRRRTSN